MTKTQKARIIIAEREFHYRTDLSLPVDSIRWLQSNENLLFPPFTTRDRSHY